MDDKFGDVARDDEAIHVTEFQPARFHAELGLPSADDQLLKDAATSVRQEFRDRSKWKRLRCRKVSIFAERDRGTVYVTSNELRCSEDIPDQFHLFRVFDFGRSPRLYILHGALSQLCQLDPVLYRAVI